VQPVDPLEHWHADISYSNICGISYLNIRGTLYYLCSVLDGCGRVNLQCEIRAFHDGAGGRARAPEAKEKYLEATPA
jgi:hypothetical protein